MIKQVLTSNLDGFFELAINLSRKMVGTKKIKNSVRNTFCLKNFSMWRLFFEVLSRNLLQKCWHFLFEALYLPSMAICRADILYSEVSTRNKTLGGIRSQSEQSFGDLPYNACKIHDR